MMIVVAAIIEAQSRFLICQRRRDDKFPLKWEFPGGKVNRGETPPRALERELEEELGVRAEIGREVHRTRHRYSELSEEMELIFYAAKLSGEPVNLAFERVVWSPCDELGNFDFLAADQELIKLLMRGETRTGVS
jgi:8-oxo-dGTP diphosphatase